MIWLVALNKSAWGYSLLWIPLVQFPRCLITVWLKEEEQTMILVFRATRKSMILVQSDPNEVPIVICIWHILKRLNKVQFNSFFKSSVHKGRFDNLPFFTKCQKYLVLFLFCCWIKGIWHILQEGVKNFFFYFFCTKNSDTVEFH